MKNKKTFFTPILFLMMGFLGFDSDKLSQLDGRSVYGEDTTGLEDNPLHKVPYYIGVALFFLLLLSQS